METGKLYNVLSLNSGNYSEIELEKLTDRAREAYLRMGDLTQPPKTSLIYPSPIKATNRNITAHFMPAVIPSESLLGIKIVGDFANPGATSGSSGKIIKGHIMLFDALYGTLKHVVDADNITPLRCALTLSLAIESLARKDFRSVLLAGMGALGLESTKILLSTYPGKEVLVWDRNPGQISARLRSHGVNPESVAIAGDINQASEEVDVISTFTSATEPLISPERIHNGTLVCSFGSYGEIPGEVIGKSSGIVVDQVEPCLHRGSTGNAIGQGKIGSSDINTELWEVISGNKKGRTGDQEIIFFQSLGVGLIDCALASYLIIENSPKK